MDASRLTLTFALIAIGLAIGRFILDTVGQAGDGLATLFVPPDRSLGWPHGVQESDEPWGWRRAAFSAGARDGPGPLDDGDGPTGREVGAVPPPGSFVVALTPVAPVRLVVRPL